MFRNLLKSAAEKSLRRRPEIFRRRLRLEPLENRRLLSLGTAALYEGPAAGSDSVVVTYSGAWQVPTLPSWLHSTSSGNGNGLATFTFDANTGATRTSGALSFAGGTLTVTQAGSGYVAANPLTALIASNVNSPQGVAVDGAGDIYVASAGDNSIKEWNAATQTVSTLVSSGLSNPAGVAVDTSGNVYIADTFDGVIKERVAGTGTVSTLASGLNPYGLAVDGSGNVYVADYAANAIRKWNASSQTLTTPISSGLSGPMGVAVDSSGNVYIANNNNNTVNVWYASTQTLVPLVTSGLNGPTGVAVDASDNVYIANRNNNSLVEWKTGGRRSRRWSPRDLRPRPTWRSTIRATFTSPTATTTQSRSGTPRRKRSAPRSLRW